MDIELTRGNNREAGKIANHLSTRYVKELSEDNVSYATFKNLLKTLSSSNAKRQQQAHAYQHARSQITQLNNG